MEFTDAMKKAKAWVKDSSHIVFFGGAGVSTASGIPDFRSENGLYHTMKREHSPEYYFSHEFSIEDPDGFADFTRECIASYQVPPSGAHLALARLEQEGKLDAVVTQNIDSLHQRAGSKRVFEVHGNMARIYCPACGHHLPVEEFMAGKGRALCPICGEIMRPDVVLYGEPLNEDVFLGAIQAIAKADTLIVGGTSLVVYPAAGLLNYYRGHQFILLNRDPTPADSRANIAIHGNIAEILPALVED
ncbi:NAD-dependent protein deacylase [Murdochiella massiliensis]|uniref:NAD-dependent protein deacylase n=1 Tax=Murdochiella massiliensis TaxID=1673723 RepID=UPI00082CA353|nr:NAD-dependent protein deacylase [Murdochiella massiliensis]